MLKPLNPCRAESTPPPTTSISRFVFLPTKINTTQDPMRDGRDRERGGERESTLFALIFTLTSFPFTQTLCHDDTDIADSLLGDMQQKEQAQDELKRRKLNNCETEIGMQGIWLIRDASESQTQ